VYYYYYYCYYYYQFSQLTRDGEVYHDYCLNYSKAMNYLEQLRKNDEFVEFEKVQPSLVLLHKYSTLLAADFTPF